MRAYISMQERAGSLVSRRLDEQAQLAPVLATVTGVKSVDANTDRGKHGAKLIYLAALLCTPDCESTESSTLNDALEPPL